MALNHQKWYQYHYLISKLCHILTRNFRGSQKRGVPLWVEIVLLVGFEFQATICRTIDIGQMAHFDEREFVGGLGISTVVGFLQINDKSRKG